jgi:SAM-dependent methyltransferase
LEIGAGNGEHFPFVQHDFNNYTMIDLSIENLAKFRSKSGVSLIEGDFSSHDFGTEKFDRVIMTCVLHHLCNPYEALNKVRLVLKSYGIFPLFLPCDPGFLNRLNRKLILFPISKSMGILDYPLINAIEHKNHIWSLHTMLTEIFADFEISHRYYPFRFKSFNFNTFIILQIKRSLGS